MENTLQLPPSASPALPRLQMSSLFRQSYTFATKQVQESVQFIKEEFTGLYDKTSHYLHRMAMPVNNFLKDFTQIEAEFKKELNIMPDPVSLPGVVAIHEAVLSGSMEENY